MTSFSQDIESHYRTVFQTSMQPLIVRSPGRVNIIGEHMDYNEGYVLPAAIDKAIYVAVGKREDEEIHLYSVSFKEMVIVSLSAIEPSNSWTTYILGVVAQLQKNNYSIGGFNLVLNGDVPVGAGLSSSAAVECATAFALNELYAFGISRMEMVRMAQKAEQTYAGVMCGIMDQFASMMGKAGQVMKLDCRSLQFDYVPMNLEGYKIVLLNTNIKHTLSSSEYNTRRQECEQGVAWIQGYYPEVQSLRDATMEMLNQCVLIKDKLVYRRCKYVVQEKARLIDGCEDLQAGNLWALGDKMYRTHDGLSKEYEVSCKELDFLVDAVRYSPNVPGARMMGGGFGGCTINLVRETAIEMVIDKVSKRYKEATGLETSAYIAQLENGTSLLTHPKTITVA